VPSTRNTFEGASPAILARARYLNVVPARDTKSSDSEPACGPKEANAIIRKFAVADLTDGTIFTYDKMNEAHEEATATLQGATDELSRARLGFAHYYLRDPLTLVEDPSVPVESVYLRKMADIVGAVLCGGPCSTSESDEDVYSSILPGDWFRLATFMTAAIARGCVRSTNLQKKGVTDLQGPPSERTPEQKLWDFKTRAQQYARDRESCDNVRISYLEFLETEAEDDLALARMIAG
jgi:hypothetical protein